jgi:hypothetical protein
MRPVALAKLEDALDLVAEQDTKSAPTSDGGDG